MNTLAKRTIKTAAIVGAVALLSGVAIAAGRGGAMGGGMMGGGPGYTHGGMMGGGMMGGGMMSHGSVPMSSATLAAGQLDAVKEKLNLTTEQKPYWTTYTEAVGDFSDSMRSMHESMNPDTMIEMSAEDRRAFAESVHASRTEELNGIRDAWDKLVQALSPEQKSAVESLTGGHAFMR